MFARRGTGGPGLLAVLAVVLVAFLVGIGVGWGTGQLGSTLAAPEASPSASPSPSAEPELEVSLPPLEPITRELDDDDRLAGLVSLDVPTEGEGTFRTVTLDGVPSGEAAAVRWVRVEVEDGLDMDGSALATFVLAALNDPRGWGANGRYEFVPTAGASDIRVVIASPTTAATMCPNPHTAATVVGNDDDASAEPEASPSPVTSATEDVPCTFRGIVAVSQYDWAAGLTSYGDDTTGARVYLVNHGVGHVLGNEDGVCASGRALIMTDQVDLSEDCEPNPWPWPDEPLPEPSPSATASNVATIRETDPQ